MKDQGENRTSKIPLTYGGSWQVNWVLQSNTTAVFLVDLEHAKLELDMEQTTISGTNIQQEIFPSYLKVLCTILGQTDVNFSKGKVHPFWYGYAMRERAPFKEDIDKWFDLKPYDNSFRITCIHMYVAG